MGRFYYLFQKLNIARRMHYESLHTVGQTDLILRMPFLKYLPGLNHVWKNAAESKHAFHTFLEKVCNKYVVIAINQE